MREEHSSVQVLLICLQLTACDSVLALALRVAEANHIPDPETEQRRKRASEGDWRATMEY